MIDREALFWSHVEKTESCWLYSGYLNKDGYAPVKFHSKMTTAHRLSWTLANGPIGGGLYCLHRCDIRTCVNPQHLFLGTARDNALDARAKGRNTRGSLHSKAILVEDDIPDIFTLRAAGWTYLEIANHFRVSRDLIWRVLHGQRWAHVWR